MMNIVDRRQIISKIHDNEFDNKDLNLWLKWAIPKYATEIIDLIINHPDYTYIDKTLNTEHLTYFVFYNDIERFKYFVNTIKIQTYSPPHGYGGGSYKLMKDVCWDNKLDFLKLIVDLPELDFSRNDFMIVRKTYMNGHYEALSLLLQNREELKKEKELYNKYAHVLRSSKLNQLQKRIYTNK